MKDPASNSPYTPLEGARTMAPCDRKPTATRPSTPMARTLLLFVLALIVLPAPDAASQVTETRQGNALRLSTPLSLTRARMEVTGVDLSDQFTIEYWFKGTSMQSIVRLQPDAANFLVAGWNGKHILSWDGGTGGGVAVGASATDGNWHHVAVTWRSNGQFTSYLDGQVVESRPAQSQWVGLNPGSWWIGSYGGTSEFGRGEVDEIRIWSVERSAAEIAAHRNRPLDPVTPGLKAYVRFNVQGSTIPDIGTTVTILSTPEFTANAPINLLDQFSVSSDREDLRIAWVAPSSLVSFFEPSVNGITQATIPGTATQRVLNPRLNESNEYCIEAVSLVTDFWHRACQTGKAIVLAPSGMRLASSKPKAALVSWTNNSSIATGIDVFRRNMSQPDSVRVTQAAAASTFFLDTGIPQPGTYRYCVVTRGRTVQMVSQGQPEEPSAPVCLTQEVRPMAGSLAASDGDFEDRVELTWSSLPVSDVRARIERDGVPIGLVSSSSTRYGDGTAVPGTTYTYCLIASAADGTEDYPVCDQGTRRIFPVTGLTASFGTSEDGVLLSWSDRSAVEASYRVTRRATPGGTAATLVELPAGSQAHLDAQAVALTDYEYCVVAVDGQGRTSAPACAAGRRAAVAPPAIVVATDGEIQGFVRVTWTDQSTSEVSFVVYRDGTLVTHIPIASKDTPGKGAQYQLLTNTPLAAVDYLFCVEARTAAGVNSIQVCDTGRMGGLTPPANVVASDDTFDDRVRIRWEDVADTETAFEVHRAPAGSGQQPTLLTALPANSREYNDPTALQGVAYLYCVRATADGGTAVSEMVCDTGTRSNVLAPTLVKATDGTFENKVDVSWSNPSTTAMVIELERAGPLPGEYTLVATRSPGETTFSDARIPSDTGIEYCVSALTIPGASVSLRAQVAEALIAANAELALSLATGDEEPEPGALRVRDAIAGMLSVETAGKSGSTSGVVRSERVCATGRRSLKPPTSVKASFRDHEDRVQVSWTDRSSFETGYEILRAARGSALSAAVSVQTVAANRVSAGDYSGAPGTEYTYWVRAVDAWGHSVGVEAPGFRELKAPTAFSASDGTSETEVTLEWLDNSRAEDGYRIYRDGVLIADQVTTTRYADTGATFGVTHTYGIEAFDAYGASTRVTDEGRTTILSPGSFSASSTYDTRVVLVWEDRSGVESGYRILRNGTEVQTLAADLTFAIDVPPSAGTDYEYCIEAFSAASTSARRCATGRMAVPEVAVTQTITMYDLLEPADGGKTGDPATDFNYPSYGRSLDLSRDLAIVGSYPPTTSAISFAGAAYVFAKIDGTWQEQDRLTAVGATSRFGASVAISGDYAVVGDPWDANRRGAAHIFRRDGTSWTWVQKLTLDGGQERDQFGSSVDIDGNRIVIGHARQNVNLETRAFGVQVYVRSGTNWVLRGGPALPDFYQLGSPASFGDNVLIEGNTIVVGVQSAGRVWVFTNESGNWNETAVFGGTRWLLNGNFGKSISLSGDQLVVGADGAAFFFKRQQGSDFTEVCAPTKSCNFGVWGIQTILTAGIGTNNGVSIHGNLAVVGTEPIYLVSRHGDTWKVAAKLQGSPGTDANSFAPKIAYGDILATAAVNPFPRRTVFFSAATGSAEGVTASDGSYKDRIQIRWDDVTSLEDGFNIYRVERDETSDDALNATRRVLLASVGANIESYSDFSAPAGKTLEYCVSAFNTALADVAAELGESVLVCDIGWRPPNGHIGGRIAARGGGGTLGAQVCALPLGNGGLLFDGNPTLSGSSAQGNGGYAAAPHSDVLDLDSGDPFTLEVWVRFSDAQRQNSGGILSDDWVPAILSKGRINAFNGPFASSNPTPFGLYVRNGSVDFRRRGAGDVSKAVSGSSNLGDGAWHHVAVVNDPGASRVRLYYDGVLEAESSEFPAGSTLNDEPLYFGWSGIRTNLGWFGGQLDEVRIWSTARTRDEIAGAMSSPLTGLEPGLVGYWPLDEGSLRVASDRGPNALHATLYPGAYWSEEGSPLDLCVTTDDQGNYTMPRLTYGASSTFKVIPSKENRQFAPAFKTITLSADSPVQNEVDFSDETTFTVSGRVVFATVEGTQGYCPVPNVDILVDGTIAQATESDGSFAVAVQPSSDANDPRTVTARYVDPNDPSEAHEFLPPALTQLISADVPGVLFQDTKKRTLLLQAQGGCGISLGTAQVRVFTEDGCFDRTYTVTDELPIQLPPQKYLVRVTGVTTNSPLRGDIIDFYDNLGAVEVDLTAKADTAAMVYRAPISVVFSGLDAQCPSGIAQVDGSGTVLRTLPSVPVLTSGDSEVIRIEVVEDYGNGLTCAVDGGTVSIFDGIGDKADTEVKVELDGNPVTYPTTVGTADVLTGRRVDGVDRSFQKSLTAVATVPGRDAVTETLWAVVEGERPRVSTFTSFTTEEVPLMILRDPPGDASSAYLKSGTEFCSALKSAILTDNGVGIEFSTGTDAEIAAGPSFGFSFLVITSASTSFSTKFELGNELGQSDLLKTCLNLVEGFKTSDSPVFTGEQGDVYIGAAFNLIFARADRVDVDNATCKLVVDDVLAGGLNANEPFATAYGFTQNHIQGTIIPTLESLRQASDEQIVQLDEDQAISLTDAIDNWRSHLALNRRLKDQATFRGNRSFSAGAPYDYSLTNTESKTVEWTTKLSLSNETSTDIDLKALGFKMDSKLALRFKLESSLERTTDTNTTSEVGYTLADNNVGDYFSADVLEDPVYKTPVFRLKSGRSSAPWEPGIRYRNEFEACRYLEDPADRCPLVANGDWPFTQPRDSLKLEIDPPVRYGVAADETATFTLSLSNLSQSNEAREYVVKVVPTSNPGGAVIADDAASSISGGHGYFVGPNQTQEITIGVSRGPSRYSYNDLAIMAYPQGEYAIWDAGGSLQLADTVRFSVQFEAPCTAIDLVRPQNPWTYSSIDAATGPLDVIARGFDLGSPELDVVRLGAQYRKRGTPDSAWLDGKIVEYAFNPATGLYTNTRDPNDSFGKDRTFFATGWQGLGQTVRDGVYEMRAYSECKPDVGPNRFVYSDPILGTIDTTPPVPFGTPEPGDGILALGDDIKVVFNEDIVCSTLSTETGSANVTLVYADGAGAGTGIPVTSACDGRGLTIVPTSWAGLENRLLKARILSRTDAPTDLALTDRYGNGVAQTIEWTFTVQRSALAWRPSNLAASLQAGSEATLTAALANGRGQAASYTLAGVPTWLTPNRASGTVPPGGEASVEFDVSPTLSRGLHTATVRATNADGDALLYVSVDVGCIAPEWSVNPAAYSFAMSVTARILLDDTTPFAAGDVLAAFVGTELRGVATLDDLGDGFGPLARLSIYSNSAGGETVTFRAFSGTRCGVIPGAELSVPPLYGPPVPSLVFVHGTTVGTGAQPLLINATTEAQWQTLSFSRGWNWFSVNRDGDRAGLNDLFSQLRPLTGDLVKTQSSFAVFDGGLGGWVGPLAAVQPGLGYKLKLSEPGTSVVTGTPVDPVATPLGLRTGWNWIGYTPQGSAPVNEALAGLFPAPGPQDVIKSQFQFAQYNGSQWVGSLTHLHPGLGYLLKVSTGSTLSYPMVPARLAADPGSIGILEPASMASTAGVADGRPAWAREPGSFANSMTVTARLLFNQSPPSSDLILEARVGDELRGLATYEASAGDGLTWLMVYSDEATGESVHLSVFDPASDVRYDLGYRTPFVADGTLGTALEPVALEIGHVNTGVAAEIPTEFALEQNYPNPFNPSTSIQYDLPHDIDVTITLFDVIGREVVTLVDGFQRAGRHALEVSGRELTSGVYFYRIKAGAFNATRRMTLIK